MGHQTTCRLSAVARRETILNAAIRLFSEKGFRGTTTRELSAAVGVSEPVLYEHFRTKQDLYDAMMQRMLDLAIHELNTLMERHGDVSDTGTFLLGVATAMAEWFRKEPGLVRLLLFSALDGENLSQSFHSRFRGRFMEALTGFLAARGRHDCRPRFNPQIVAHAFICMTAHHGLLQVLFEHHPSETGEEVIREMVDIFMRGICK